MEAVFLRGFCEYKWDITIRFALYLTDKKVPIADLRYSCLIQS
ncbi:MAG: hypothetical protein ACI88A_002159, partial [Paraglaciecola sp.]